jgi:ABC-2 type transport system ATP-binding protein
MPAIDLEALTVRYGEFVAVESLTLQVRRGELFGLLGPNGAGKSTTIRVLIGQRRPAGGRVRILGYDLQQQWDTIKPLFGYMPDRENHFDEFTGRQNLRFFADLYRLPAPAARVDECLRAVELDEAADVKVGGYSMGMRRKLMLARTLLHDPPVLYLDEPTANLDVHSVEVVHRILRKRVAAGKTVLLTTHDMDEVEAICDRSASCVGVS